MSLLLDTQALLWFLLDDPRLSGKAQAGIVATEVSIFVSPASIWEIAIKISLGKYALPSPFVTFWGEQLQTNDFSLLPISVSHAARVMDLPFHHRDPFDRFVVPKVDEQRKIAAILSAYDDLIENNLRRIKLLEEMAQNLYREWFVNFRFPGHQSSRFIDSPSAKSLRGGRWDN